MSGGFFNYDQSRIRNMIDSIEYLIENNGRAKTEQELKDGCVGTYDYHGYISSVNYKEYYEKYPDEKFFHAYSDEVVEEFKKAVQHLGVAYVYAQRIDWLVSGDDGEESFMERLKDDLTLKVYLK